MKPLWNFSFLFGRFTMIYRSTYLLGPHVLLKTLPEKIARTPTNQQTGGRTEDPPQKAWMGQERDVVVLTAHRRRFLDTFGAVGGTLKSGGLLLFQTPPLEVWREERLGSRWCNLVESLRQDPKTSEMVTILQQNDGMPELSEVIQASPRARRNVEVPTPNQEQQILIDKILKIKSSRPLLIFGRRGRGKSACLGMAAAILLQRTGGRIIVTSPSKEATSQAFWSAEKFLASEKVRRISPYRLRFGRQGSMEFVEPQMLSRLDLKETAWYFQLIYFLQLSIPALRSD